MKELFRLALPSILLPFLACFASLGTKVAAQNAYSLAPFNPFPQDTIYLCGNDTVLLNAGSGYTLYQWSTGDTTQTIKAAITGNYSVEVVDTNGDRFYDEVFVSVIWYTMDALTTQPEPFLQHFDSVSDKTVIISLQYPVNKETILYNNKGSIWVAPDDCVIDSLSFSIVSFSPESSTEPSYGIVTVYEMSDNNLEGFALLKGTYYWAVHAPGLVTLPVNLNLRKGKTYHFNFGKGVQLTQSFFGNTCNLRTGVVEGFSKMNNQGKKTLKALPNGVWMKLQGKRISYQDAGNTFYTCHSNPITINVSKSDLHYLWAAATEVTAIKFTPQTDTTIYINISNNFHTCRDSAVIDVFNVPFNPFKNDSIFACSTTSFPLHANTAEYNFYNWNTGSKDTSIVANTDAWYKVQAVGGQNCVASDSVYVTVMMPQTISYRFTGNGLYSDAANWEVLGETRPGKPPAIIGPHEAIYIDPSGVCIMDVQQTISDCSEFTIRPNAKLIMQSSLILKK